MPLLVLALVILTLALSAPAQAAPCGTPPDERDRCHVFGSAGAVGAMARGPDGRLWFVGNGFIGRLSSTGAVARFGAPTNGASDITAGPDGGLWFTAPGQVGRIGTDGQVRTFSVGGSPGGIAAAGGALWFTDGGTVKRIGTGGGVSSYGVGGSTNGRGSITRGPDGAAWATVNPPALVRLDGGVSRFGMEGFGRQLRGIAAGPDGGLWFAAYDARRVGRMTTGGAVTGSYSTAHSPEHVAGGPSFSVWFTMHDLYRNRYELVRLSPTFFPAIFDMGLAAGGVATGGPNAIYVSKGSSVQLFTPFVGAYPIKFVGARRVRTNAITASNHSGQVRLRLYCPIHDNLLCAGRVSLLSRGRVLGAGTFSQRVNDGPTTLIPLTAAGRSTLHPGSSLRLLVRIAQHDLGGTRRTRTFAMTVRRDP